MILISVESKNSSYLSGQLQTVLRVLCFILGSGLMFGLPASAQARPSDTGHLTVLMYHRFDAGGAISIPMEDFKRQINHLQSNGYNFVSLSRVRRHLADNEPFPAKSVLITIDDGYQSTYTRAYPYLKKQGIPWALYVYTRSIDRNFSSALTWPQIREMARNGVAVANHTHSHGHPVSGSFRSGDWIRREIQDPQARLEDEVDSPVFSFAIPYGEYDRKLLKTLRDTEGYEVVWGIDPGPVQPQKDQLVLPRFGINGSTSWTEFKDKLSRLPLDVKSLDPKPGEHLNSGGDTIRLELANPDRYRDEPVNVFLSELGRMEWSWSSDGRTIVVPVQSELEKDWNRIIVTAYDSEYGRYRFFSRGFPTLGSE
ncbi:MAG: polysaccharide deacetylase family protein [bacterium]